MTGARADFAKVKEILKGMVLFPQNRVCLNRVTRINL